MDDKMKRVGYCLLDNVWCCVVVGGGGTVKKSDKGLFGKHIDSGDKTFIHRNAPTFYTGAGNLPEPAAILSAH